MISSVSATAQMTPDATGSGFNSFSGFPDVFAYDCDYQSKHANFDNIQMAPPPTPHKVVHADTLRYVSATSLASLGSTLLASMIVLVGGVTAVFGWKKFLKRVRKSEAAEQRKRQLTPVEPISKAPVIVLENVPPEPIHVEPPLPEQVRLQEQPRLHLADEPYAFLARYAIRIEAESKVAVEMEPDNSRKDLGQEVLLETVKPENPTKRTMSVKVPFNGLFDEDGISEAGSTDSQSSSPRRGPGSPTASHQSSAATSPITVPLKGEASEMPAFELPPSAHGRL